MSNEDQIALYVASQSYLPPAERADVVPEHGLVKMEGAETSDVVGYYHKERNQVFIGHRGTDPNNPKNLSYDLVNDYGILMGLSGFLSRNTEGAILSRAAKLLGAEIIHTGHSLGGTIASNAAHDENTRSIVFNPGSSPKRGIPFYRGATVLRHDSNGQNVYKHKIFVHKNDPISMTTQAAGLKGDEYIKSFSGGTHSAHSLQNFYSFL